MASGRTTRSRAALAVATGLLIAGGAWAQTDVDESMKADRDGAVEIENIAGNVRVEGWDRAEVSVTGTLGEGVEELRFERQGDRIEIEVIYPEEGNSKGADLTVKVPAASRVDVETVSADIDARGLSGKLELHSVSGEVEVEAGSKSLDIETISGDIDVAATKDVVIEAESVSGNVTLRFESGEFDAQTVSGDVEVRVDKLAEGEGQSVSGDVDFDGDLVKGCRLDLESHSGDIDLMLPAGVSAEVELESYSGDLTSEFAGDDREGEWNFVLGDGKARVEVDTFSGDVEVKKKG